MKPDKKGATQGVPGVGRAHYNHHQPVTVWEEFFSLDLIVKEKNSCMFFLKKNLSSWLEILLGFQIKVRCPQGARTQPETIHIPLLMWAQTVGWPTVYWISSLVVALLKLVSAFRSVAAASPRKGGTLKTCSSAEPRSVSLTIIHQHEHSEGSGERKKILLASLLPAHLQSNTRQTGFARKLPRPQKDDLSAPHSTSPSFTRSWF